MALIGNTFYQDSSLDPGAGYPMYYWSQTDTGLVYIRNYTDDHWIIVGDTTQPCMGCLSTQGGNVNGPISGAHGLSPNDSNNFTTDLYERGLEVVTVSYVDTKVSELEDAITSSVATAVAALPTLSLDTRIIHKTGVWSHPSGGTGISSHVIDLPVYNDGITQAIEGECIWGAYFNEYQINTGYFSHGTYTIVESAPRSFTVTAILTDGSMPACTITWFILAFRTNT